MFAIDTLTVASPNGAISLTFSPVEVVVVVAVIVGNTTWISSSRAAN